MEGLECDVCHEIMDEDELRPRIIKCGHTACSVCVKKLIRNDTLECPSCRQSYQVNSVDDLTVNFGVIKMIRVQKGARISSKSLDASKNQTDKNNCSIHGSLIIKMCQKCKVWVCQHCLEFHKAELGCNVVTAKAALKEIKENHLKLAHTKINNFKFDLSFVSAKQSEIVQKKHKHRDEITKHRQEINRLEEEINKLDEDENKNKEFLKDGNDALSAVIASHDNLNSADNHQDMSNCVHSSLQRECYLELWTKKHIAHLSISMMLRNGKEVYSTLFHNGTEYGAKFDLNDGILKLSSHKTDPIPISAFFVQYESIKKLMESSPTAHIVFLEISIDGKPKLELHIRPHQNMPNLAKSLTRLCSGEYGINLINLGFSTWGSNYMVSGKIEESKNLPNLSCDTASTAMRESGSVIVNNVTDGNVSGFGLVHKPINYGNTVGIIIVGLEKLQSLVNSATIDNVKISNCGLILQTN